MKRENILLNENDRLFRSVVQKIGIAMILHVVLFFAFNSLTAILSGILSVFLKEAGYFISEILMHEND